MRPSILALSLILATASTPLVGCQTFRTIAAGHSVADSAPKTMAEAEKLLTVTHYAYDGLGTTLKGLAETRMLHGKSAADAKVVYDKIGATLDLADAADRAANMSGILTDVKNAQDLIAQADAIIHSKPH